MKFNGTKRDVEKAITSALEYLGIEITDEILLEAEESAGMIWELATDNFIQDDDDSQPFCDDTFWLDPSEESEDNDN